MSRKGVFPYEYISDLKKLDDKILASQEWFYNFLTVILLGGYERCSSVKHYYIVLYLQSDVLILTGVFENFGILCLEVNKLDPRNCATAPSFS